MPIPAPASWRRWARSDATRRAPALLARRPELGTPERASERLLPHNLAAAALRDYLRRSGARCLLYGHDDTQPDRGIDLVADGLGPIAIRARAHRTAPERLQVPIDGPMGAEYYAQADIQGLEGGLVVLVGWVARLDLSARATTTVIHGRTRSRRVLDLPWSELHAPADLAARARVVRHAQRWLDGRAALPPFSRHTPRGVPR